MNRMMKFLLIARVETRLNKGQRSGYVTIYLRRWVKYWVALNRVIQRGNN